MKELLLAIALTVIWLAAVIIIGVGNQYTMTHHPSINHNDYTHHGNK